MNQPKQTAVALSILEAMRPAHWVKNLFVLAALPFSGKWSAWPAALGAFAAFCLLSSGIYLINDIADRKADRAHPTKRRRAVASGRLSAAVAAGAAIVLLAAGAGIIACLAAWTAGAAGVLAFWAGAYVVGNLAYSFGLKRAPILDVLVVATGFVLRAMAGAAAIAVPPSPWLVVCTFMLCLFIALAKRRGEVAALGDAAVEARSVHGFYNLSNLEHMLAVSAGLAILTYTLYCLAPHTVRRVGSAHLIWSVPVVVYGMFRYYCLTRALGDEDPVRILLRDRVLWLVGVAWLACVLVVLKYGRDPAVRDLLLR